MQFRVPLGPGKFHVVVLVQFIMTYRQPLKFELNLNYNKVCIMFLTYLVLLQNFYNLITFHLDCLQFESTFFMKKKMNQFFLLLFLSGQNNGAAACSSAEDDYDNCTVYQDLDKQIPETPAYLGLSKGLPEGAPTTEIPNSRHSTMPDTKMKPSAGGILSSKANGTIGVLKSKSATERPKRGPIIAQEPVYNVLDGPGTGPRTTTEPLYNVLEGHEYATPNVDPLYNVLEGPDSNRSVSKSGANTTKEALYNVLEGPDGTNGPTNKQGTENDAIYNVLEAPESDKNSLVAQVRSGPGNEPLYSVREEQDGDGSKQNVPNKSSSLGGVANPAYEQTLDFNAPYAAVHRPGARGKSLYEPLRRPGQEVYEPLG